MATVDSKQLSGHAKDETGNVYGKLTVVDFAYVKKSAHWNCRCQCGTEMVVAGVSLRSGRVASCGCSHIKDMTGQRFGKLTVVQLANEYEGALARWICQCDCGTIKTIAGSDLRRGSTKSCGCHRASQGGGYKTTEYTSWKEMKRRCYNPRYDQYYLYGGRGIVICDRWRTSFVNFLADMGPKPFPEATIDRFPDNNGPYSPINSRWATKPEQSHNTRKVRLLTHNGETMTLREWARKLGISHCTLRVRIAKGWPPEKVFSTEHYFSPPPKKRKRVILLD